MLTEICCESVFAKWPAPYELQVTAFNEATDAEEKSKLRTLMPHEVVHALLKVNDPRVSLGAMDRWSPIQF